MTVSYTHLMRDVSITFDPNAKEGQAAMADNRPLVKKLAIYAENVKEIDPVSYTHLSRANAP